MDHDDNGIESWLYDANRDLDDATATEIDVEGTLTQIKHRVVQRTAEFTAPAGSAELVAAESRRQRTTAREPDAVVAVAMYGDPGATLSGALIRPYTRTGGRTRSGYDLALEALVSTSERGKEPFTGMLAEHRVICGLCLDTRSVAEVAALVKLPIGTVRVLIGDMAEMGLVDVHNPPRDGPSTRLLERVRDGLAKLGSPQHADEDLPMGYEVDTSTERLPVYEAVLSQWVEAADSEEG